jgi:hypothetical protein
MATSLEVGYATKNVDNPALAKESIFFFFLVATCTLVAWAILAAIEIRGLRKRLKAVADGPK